jgi:protein phosphatase
MPLTVTFAALSDPGRRHPVNEDRWLADPDRGLFLVTDGMANDVAPQLMVERLPDLLHKCLAGISDLSLPKAATAVRWAVNEMNALVRGNYEQRPDLEDLGATLVLVLIRQAVALIAHLGDSRVYCWQDGQLQPLTQDHSLARQMLEEGSLTKEEFARCQRGGGPVQYLGMSCIPTPTIRLLELQDGAVLLLCSDGLTGMVSDDLLATHLSADKPPGEICSSLIAAANAAGGEDNITAVVVVARPSVSITGNDGA